MRLICCRVHTVIFFLLQQISDHRDTNPSQVSSQQILIYWPQWALSEKKITQFFKSWQSWGSYGWKAEVLPTAPIKQPSNSCENTFFMLQLTPIILEVRVYCIYSFHVFTSFGMKDPVPDRLRSRVAYKFSCVGCSARYVGETSRHFAVHVCEHLSTDRASHIHKQL